MNARKLIWLAGLVPAVLAAAGCAGPQGGHGLAAKSASNYRPAAPADRQALARQYDQHRDDAQFQQAEALWQRNDIHGCRRMLEEIAARNPRHRGAHLRLAELYLFVNQSAKALELMQRFCQQHRDDAEGHHLLGLCHEARGNDAAALAAFERAVQGDPEEALYRTSLEISLESQGRSTKIAAKRLPTEQRATNESGEAQAWATAEAGDDASQAGEGGGESDRHVRPAYQLESDDGRPVADTKALIIRSAAENETPDLREAPRATSPDKPQARPSGLGEATASDQK
jgi:tetratricopeptide (TPR) repeat protein